MGGVRKGKEERDGGMEREGEEKMRGEVRKKGDKGGKKKREIARGWEENR